ncbi:hypothetical protein ABPG74_010874 [Tetrahymena malaccensis]
MVKSTSIDFTLLKEKKKLLRYDVLPFIFIHSAVLYWWYESSEEDDVYPRLAVIVSAFLNCIAYLLGHWSQRMKAKICFSSFGKDKSDDALNNATFVLVHFEKKSVRTVYEIVPLKYDTDNDIFFIHFTEKKYIFDNEKKDFYRLKPQLNDLKIKDFQTLEIKQDTTNFDLNSLEIPIRKFADVFKDQIMEPFSFFQIFSVSLWLMDENRFYSLLTLFMLFMSAFTVVIQRMRTMMMLRQMKLQPQYINVLREKKWVKISSEELMPGDIVQIQTADSIKAAENTNQISDEEYLKQQIPYAHLFPQKLFVTESSNANTFKYLPCDMLILSGTCVVNESVLTGESVPQIKDSIEKVHGDEILDLKNKHKNSVLFCGTEVIQTFPSDRYPESIRNRPDKQSCLAYVLRTGFDTSKGKLIRTVIFNNENVQIKQKDAFALIFVLLIFSIISSAYVLIHGLEDQERSKNKLFIRCILIITTVVPPELPMILTIAVNSSLLYLQRKKIFCTEPYRIPFGGKITMCAFDKTGTLTSDTLKFKGIVDNTQDFKALKGKSDVNIQAQCVLAGCHSLLQTDKKLQGDPIETLFFEESEWTYNSGTKTAKKKGAECRIINMFPFKSDLKRMSTVVHWEGEGASKEYRVLCKGAPETIEQLLTEVPPNYVKAYKYYSKLGYRVLSLAYGKLNPDMNFNDVERQDIEKNLTFAGLFICDSPLKFDTKQYITILQQAKYQLLMITGDNILTAVAVSNKLDFGPHDYLLLESKDGQNFVWIDSEEKERKANITLQELKDLCTKYTLCLIGPTIDVMIRKTPLDLQKIIYKHVQIYARTSPAQKEHIIFTLRQAGEHCLMCGDGTNDVGALKKADLGIALVGIKEDNPQERRQEKERKKKIQEEIKRDYKKMMQYMKEEQEKKKNQSMFGDQIEYKVGDACIAAPFTNKHSNSIRCVIILLRQGICTLVTTIQTYKILALNSLLSAYNLSVLNLEALKFSETQQTILGITSAIAFYQFSNSKPLKQISSVKPVSTIFEPYFFLSVIGQVALHLYGNSKCVDIGLKYSTKEDLAITHDQEFKPTFLNTTIFLFSLLSQTCIFLFNNGGEPHMEGFSKHTKFFKILIACLAGSFIFSMNLFPELSEYFELKFEGVPEEANNELVTVFSIIAVTNYVMEISLRYLKFGKLFNWI